MVRPCVQCVDVYIEVQSAYLSRHVCAGWTEDRPQGSVLFMLYDYFEKYLL